MLVLNLFSNHFYEFLNEFLPIIMYVQNNMKGRYVMKEITQKMIDEAITDGWSVENATRGYGIFTSPHIGNGATHIERLDTMNVFDSDMEAAIQAQRDGIKLIQDLEFGSPEKHYCFLDTPKNRKLLKGLSL